MRLGFIFALGLGVACWTGPASAQTYPDRPIKIVVPFAAGGGGDSVARAWSDKLSEALHVPVVIENRGGANTILGTQLVANARPDGYTLLLVNPNFATNPALVPKLNYRTPEDFAPITLVFSYPMGLGAAASFPPNSIPELIDYAKQNPGKVNFGTSGAGSTSHLSGELLKAAAGIEMTHVPYRGAGPATTALVGGHIQLVFTGMAQLAPHVKAGNVKLLGSSGLERLKTAPEVPTIAEQGLPGFEAIVWWGLVAPGKTPPEIVAKLNGAVRRVLADPAVQVRMGVLDGEVRTTSPEEFERFVRAEIQKWGGLIKQAGITAE
jgi:tripartite-type tricarboxylate transporter receptor subunit TctC